MKRIFIIFIISFCAIVAPAAIRGDVDGNGTVDVSDISSTINVIINKISASQFYNRSDVNVDGTTDVSDINYIVNIILNLDNDNRICLAYAPYYRSRLPRANIVTHICFSAAEVYVRNNVYKYFRLQGDNNIAALQRVLDLKKQNPYIKILLSFTHTVVNSDNYQDGGFSAIAASESNRIQFAKDCLAYMQKWGLDGIDLDWEMPGISWSGAACDPINDTDNFTLLVKQLRDTFGDNYLITLAGYVKDKRLQDSGSGWKYFDLKAIKPYLDWVNIMTYDLDDATNGHRGFNSAISSKTSYWDIERTLAEYNAAGYDASQMVLGIPFYVRHSFETSPSVIDYKDFYLYHESVGYNFNNWDNEAQCPYVTLNGVFYGSYDNALSIEAKGLKYIATGKVRGLMYWDAGADDIDYTLANACWRAVTRKY